MVRRKRDCKREETLTRYMSVRGRKREKEEEEEEEEEEEAKNTVRWEQ